MYAPDTLDQGGPARSWFPMGFQLPTSVSAPTCPPIVLSTSELQYPAQDLSVT
jgi:hypothetical protein